MAAKRDRGIWASPTQAQRKSPKTTFTLDGKALRALAWLAGLPAARDKSAEVRAALIERAERLGWQDPGEEKNDKGT
jgi:hypothetical protein